MYMDGMCKDRWPMIAFTGRRIRAVVLNTGHLYHAWHIVALKWYMYTFQNKTFLKFKIWLMLLLYMAEV